jgi:heterotetrameric sarcosine oxidase gamma subunit
MHELAAVPFARSLPTSWSLSNDVRLRISERPLTRAVLIKSGRHLDPARLASRLSVTLPLPNTYIAQTSCRWLWQGPREWLVIGDSNDSPSAEQLRHALDDIVAFAWDVADRTLHLQIAGSQATRLLASGTSLDVSLLPAGACCRTRFANLHVTILRTGPGEDFELIVDRVHAVSLHAWLERAVENLALK